MTTIMKSFIAALSALLIAAPSFAQAPRSYSQAELDQMLAPVALYPDPLLSQVLMAATYPLEVAEAARWSRANSGLQGDDAVRAAQNEDWDPSVKSLVAFPQILARMAENPQWTQSLGDAFLAQEPHVMDTVQQLRRRAQAAGNLQSSEQIHVRQQGQTILVLPASPQYVYVPYYDPLVVYGQWWWPAYRPVVWAPWPGYVRAYRPGITVGFWWGQPVGLSANFFFGDFDWHRRHVRVVHVQNHYYRPPLVVHRSVTAGPGRWHHDPGHRRGIDYRAPEVRQRFAEFQPRNNTENRREERRHPGERHQVLSQPQERQAQTPARAQPQERAQPRLELRDDRRERGAAMDAQRNAQQQQARQAQESQRHAQHQARQQAQDAQRQSRQERRENMPAAQAQQQPRAAREESRQDRREKRQGQREHRQERDEKG